MQQQQGKRPKDGRAFAAGHCAAGRVGESFVGRSAMMQRAKYDHVLNLKITSEMLAEIDKALVEMRSNLRSRSEFLRAAVAYSLMSLAEDPSHFVSSEDNRLS
jgi:hypothetical protein